MYRRLKNFLPIVLFTLAVQIFAPIGACWATAIAASDPLARAVICHGNTADGSSQSDQSGPHQAHNGCCSVCSVLHTGAPLDTPQTALIVNVDRARTAIVWQEFPAGLVGSSSGSPPPARAPPLAS